MVDVLAAIDQFSDNNQLLNGLFFIREFVAFKKCKDPELRMKGPKNKGFT